MKKRHLRSHPCPEAKETADAQKGIRGFIHYIQTEHLAAQSRVITGITIGLRFVVLKR